jgi:conjugative transfer signal peptidase TraF
MRIAANPRRSARALRALRVAGAVFATGGIVTASILTVRRVGLTWNHTTSLPVGIYARQGLQQLRRGQIVAIEPPVNVQDLVRARGYLRPGEQLFKKVVALPGDRVCVSGGNYEVNGFVLGAVLTADRAGRPLPSFPFCGTVPGDRFWLGTTSPRSFDSRYFGPVARRDLRSSLVPVWTF